MPFRTGTRRRPLPRRRRLRSHGPRLRQFDSECFAISFYAVFIEGLEVVFIVLSLGAAGKALLSASFGAALACLLVIGLGWLAHRPLTKTPENWFKFSVGVLLTSFGLFWTVEGLEIHWPGGDMAFIGLLAAISVSSLTAVLMVQRHLRR